MVLSLWPDKCSSLKPPPPAQLFSEKNVRKTPPNRLFLICCHLAIPLRPCLIKSLKPYHLDLWAQTHHTMIILSIQKVPKVLYPIPIISSPYTNRAFIFHQHCYWPQLSWLHVTVLRQLELQLSLFIKRQSRLWKNNKSSRVHIQCSTPCVPCLNRTHTRGACVCSLTGLLTACTLSVQVHVAEGSGAGACRNWLLL